MYFNFCFHLFDWYPNINYKFSIRLKICAITAGNKSLSQKLRKQKKSMLKSKLKSISVLILKALINSVVSHDKFVLINNVQKEYDEIKKVIKNLETWSVLRT